jgi:precorrin-2 dehydrogenase/sirohydrochlorin ferrochelatase
MRDDVPSINVLLAHGADKDAKGPGGFGALELSIEERKYEAAKALLDAGARVHVVAPSIDAELEMLAQGDELLRVTNEPYDVRHVVGATLIIAATSDPVVNASIARDARQRGVLVNVADAPELGTCTTPATFREGDIVVAVSTGRVPNAAARIRDAITAGIDERYSAAVRELAGLRRRLLDDGQREHWREASRALIGDDFCEQIEADNLIARIGEWR